jgi:hypothetical protein
MLSIFNKKSTLVILFVHIPKTAGTSFRNALDKILHLLCDYGYENPVTSSELQAYIYEDNDVFKFKKWHQLKNKFSICGHLKLAKYLDFVDIKNTMSFVREPLEQVVSHYNHHIKNSNLDCSIQDFIELPQFRNIQSRLLLDLPITLVGFIGVTERYDESLAMIKTFYKLDIKALIDNRNTSPILHSSKLDDLTKKKIQALNSADNQLYQAAVDLFDKKIEFLKNFEHDCWVYSHIVIDKNNLLQSCAYSHGNSGVAVTYKLFIGGEFIKEVKAEQFYGAFPKANFPRGRYIGFYLQLSNYPKGTEIKLKVVQTGQVTFEGVC